MLDLVHLRSFIALASELHFGRAAQRLNMTQPPLSRQIRLLEEHLGRRLFDRNSQSVELTAAGLRFLPEAQTLLRQASEIEALLREDTGEPEGKLRMGFYGAASFRLLPSLMAELTRTYPRVTMELRELNAAQQINAFGFGELDIGLIRPTVLSPGLQAEVALREELLVALPCDHPLTAKSRIHPQDLDDVPFVAYGPEGPYMHSLQQAIFAEHAIAPRIVQALAHAEAILSLVSVNMGLAIVSGHAMHAPRENVTFRPLAVCKVNEALTHVITRKDARRPLVKLVAQLAREVGARLKETAAP